MRTLRCYAAAIPFFVWALFLELGLMDPEESRVPFLLVEGIAVCITIGALRSRYGRLR